MDKEKANARWRKHYRKNPEIHLRRAAIRHEKIREIINTGKDRPCTDCGISYPSYVMQYDHCRGNKCFTVADALRDHPSVERLGTEIAKCDVVCANCHAERTYQRKQEPLPERTGDGLQTR